jgi:uncharacterized protein
VTVDQLEYLKPLPRSTPESEPFWEACRRHSLELQRCDACGKFWFPPSNRCPHCLSGDWKWSPVSGSGQVFTFTVFHRAYHKGFADELPYAVAVVELHEGPRLVSNIVGCAPDDVKIGMPVAVVFEDVTADTTLFKFEPR